MFFEDEVCLCILLTSGESSLYNILSMMRRQSCRIEGLLLLEPTCYEDTRGRLVEKYQQERYQDAGVEALFVQDNEVFSHKDVLRGLHYQNRPGQAKLISVAWGKIWDVAVDLRRESPTFGCWEGVELSAENGLQFYVPIGFAHGYCVLSDLGACVTYKLSSLYNPTEERTIRWDDPTVAIHWPVSHPILSARDRAGNRFEDMHL